MSSFSQEKNEMIRRAGLVACVLAGLCVSGLVAADKLQSGPQVDKKVPGPFSPLNINGEKAGEKCCQYCRNGENPVAVVFAREVTPAVTSLIKKIDAATGKNTDAKMGSFVVFCSDSEGLEKQLKDMIAKESIKNCVLTIDQPSGPEKYEIAKDADVTVLLYVNRTVKANYAFKKGQFKDKDVDTIVSDLPKILK
jgi:hypothetical protein